MFWVSQSLKLTAFKKCKYIKQNQQIVLNGEPYKLRFIYEKCNSNIYIL